MIFFHQQLRSTGSTSLYWISDEMMNELVAGAFDVKRHVYWVHPVHSRFRKAIGMGAGYHFGLLQIPKSQR